MNGQNIPEIARKVFVPEEGWTFLSGDYTNLEVFVLAYETGDEKLIEVLTSGLNIHDENTKVLFEMTPDNPQWKLARRGAKIFQFGCIQYGGSPKEIYGNVLLEAPGLRLSFAQFERARQRYSETYTGYAAWNKRITYETLQTRKSTTFRGRVRVLMGAERDIVKQGLNTPIQGGAAHVINEATIRVQDRIEKEALKTRLVLQVHDQLVLEVPPGEMKQAKALLREEMERPVDFKGRLVTFPVELETGKTWGDLSKEDLDD